MRGGHSEQSHRHVPLYDREQWQDAAHTENRHVNDAGEHARARCGGHLRRRAERHEQRRESRVPCGPRAGLCARHCRTSLPSLRGTPGVGPRVSSERTVTAGASPSECGSRAVSR